MYMMVVLEGALLKAGWFDTLFRDKINFASCLMFMIQIKLELELMVPDRIHKGVAETSGRSIRGSRSKLLLGSN